MKQVSFQSQIQAYDWLNKNIEIGQTVLLELDRNSYQKLLYLSRWQKQNIKIAAKGYLQYNYNVTILDKLLPPKRKANNKVVQKPKKASEYFDVDEFYRQYARDKTSSSSIILTRTLPTR